MLSHTLELKPGREKSLSHRHPWVFSGAIARLSGHPQPGDTVCIRAADGRFMASGAYSPASQICARVWSWEEAEPVDAAFFARRIKHAVASRAPMRDAEHTACRWVHAESDGLPGIIADGYGCAIVLQLLSAGAERWRSSIVSALAETTGCSIIYERSDAEVRGLEGLEPRCGLLLGQLTRPLTIIEDGICYEVDIVAGQKTGFYLDQRDNRRRVRSLANGLDVLNGFCYTGAFSIAALAGGAASVLSIDSSADALAMAARNSRLNDFDLRANEWRQADVFTELRELRNQGRSFDLIILDPPKFAPTLRHADKASRAYKDINLLAFKLLRSNGLLATFSCSGGIDAGLFQKIVAGAAADAQAHALILERLGPSADHPVTLNFPEGDYLKGLLLRKVVECPLPA